MISDALGGNPASMASADRPTWQRLNFHPFILRIVLSLASVVILRAALDAQSRTSGATPYSTGESSDQDSQSSSSQVQTSVQNAVFGSVPEAKPTPGVLPLTFSDAIERALRQNLAGLLSEYNTIEARGQKWQKLSDLLPNVSADVQEVAQKESLAALGLQSNGPLGKLPPVIGPFSYFDVRAIATQRDFD